MDDSSSSDSGGKEYYEYDEWPLEYSLKKAREELNEPIDTTQAIEAFRRSILEKCPVTFRVEEDSVLLKFLRARKFHPERALTMYRKYSEMRLKYQDLYRKMTSQGLEPLFGMNGAGLLPHRDRHGRAISIVRLASWDPSQFSVEDLFILLMAQCEKGLQEPANQINGFLILIDLQGATLSQMRAAGPHWCIFLLGMVQDIFPARIKEVHFINIIPIFYFFLNLVFPFLTKKLKKRFHFYRQDLTELHKRIPPEILPEEFGGKRGSFDSSWFVQRMKDKGLQDI